MRSSQYSFFTVYPLPPVLSDSIFRVGIPNSRMRLAVNLMSRVEFVYPHRHSPPPTAVLKTWHRNFIVTLLLFKLSAAHFAFNATVDTSFRNRDSAATQ